MKNSYLTIDSFLKDEKNWPNNIDLDDFSAFYRLLYSYKKRILFSKKPCHPKLFVHLFTDEKSVLKLYLAFNKPLLSENGRIWLEEFSVEDKEKMINQGFKMDNEKIYIIIMYNCGDCFVNVFY